MSRSYPLFRPAKVMSNGDPENRGRVQLQVFPELSSVTADLPWADPFSAGIAGKSLHLPVVGSNIYCVVWNKYWTEISYFPDQVFKASVPPFKDFLDNAASKIDTLSSPAYPGINLDTEEDGFVTFHDVKGNQHGVYHPSGAFVMFAKNGDMTVRIVTKLTISDKGDKTSFVVDQAGKVTVVAKNIELTGEVKIASGSDSVVIFKPLEKVLKKLLKHKHVAPGGPTGPALESSMAPMNPLAAQLPKMKSKKTTSE